MRQAQFKRTGTGQRGFALLLVFAMAAVIAILMYIEMPRVAFEHQRDKEALLVDRGEQYVRAIQLFARRTNRFPQTLDDLEKAMNMRFLRRRYKDPMTNSDEWRLIHVDALGQLIDSKVQKKGGALDKTDSGPSVLASNVQGIGDSATLIDSSGQGNAPAYQRRASDRIIPGGALGRPVSPDQQPLPESSGGTADANQDQSQTQTPDAGGVVQGQQPAQPGGFNNPFMPPGVAAQSAAQAAAQQNQQQTNQAGTGATSPLASGTGGIGGVPRFGIPMPTGQQATAQAPTDASGAGGSTGQADAGTGSVNPQGSANSPPAIQAIQQALGAQNVGASASGTGAKTAAGPSTLGAGLAGVASTKDEQSIRVYKGQANYSLWEFIFDPRLAGMQLGGLYNPGSAGVGGAPGAPVAPNPNASFGGMGGGTPAPAGPQHN